MSITEIEKVLYTAKAHTTGGWNLGHRHQPGAVVRRRLSACFLSAIKLVAAHMKVKLPPDVAVDPEVDLGTTNGSYYIQARLNVTLPGIEREIAQKIVDAAHLECPYSKATHGNINVVTNVRTETAAQVA